MENMQYGQETQVQENQEQNAPAVQNTQAQEITQAQAAGVVDFTQAKKPEDKSLNYTHKFAKPVEIMGQKYSSLTFYFEKLTGDDVEAVELELQQRNIVVLSAEVSSAFQSSIAARAAGMASDEIRRLPLRDYMKIKNAARNFLVAAGY